MATILVTGAFGNVGRSSVAALLAEGDEVCAFEVDTPRNRRLARRLETTWSGQGRVRILYGDIRDPLAARKAVQGQDAVVHLAALIPPAADKLPELTRSVNVEGTRNLVAACRALARPPRFVLASSIAAYGDRVSDYWIRTGDSLAPSPGDVYGRTKIEAEAIVRESGLPFVILRLSYIVWRKKLRRDPLMFHMPLDTRIEVCHTEDTGRAFAAAAKKVHALGATYDIGGGERCRTTYRDYLDAMLRLFGLGGLSFLPAEAFAASGFHCGWYADSDDAERALRFRRKSLADYYVEVAEEARLLQVGAALAGPFIKARLRAASEFLTRRRDRS
jgi:nucleoside-diphosphate-sugar epimerase